MDMYLLLVSTTESEERLSAWVFPSGLLFKTVYFCASPSTAEIILFFFFWNNLSVFTCHYTGNKLSSLSPAM